jgi:hypothetical protein
MKRREFVGIVAGGAGAIALGGGTIFQGAAAAEPNSELKPKEQAMYTLTKIPYAFDALEPYIDARTMEIHHTKHHQSYVDKLNTALEKYPQLHAKPIPELIANLEIGRASCRERV